MDLISLMPLDESYLNKWQQIGKLIELTEINNKKNKKKIKIIIARNFVSHR